MYPLLERINLLTKQVQGFAANATLDQEVTEQKEKCDLLSDKVHLLEKQVQGLVATLAEDVKAVKPPPLPPSLVFRLTELDRAVGRLTAGLTALDKENVKRAAAHVDLGEHHNSLYAAHYELADDVDEALAKLVRLPLPPS